MVLRFWGDWVQVFTGRPVLVTIAAAASCQAERVATALGKAMTTQPF